MRLVGTALVGALGLFGAFLLIFGLRDIVAPQPCVFLCFSAGDKVTLFVLPGIAAAAAAAFAIRALWRRPSGGGRPAAVMVGALSLLALGLGVGAVLTQMGPDAAYADSEMLLLLPVGLLGAGVSVKLWRG